MTTSMAKGPLLLLLALLFSVGACGPETQGPDGVPNDALAALVVTSDFESGAYATVDIDSLAVHADIAAIHPDAVCRVDHTIRRPFLIERFGADAVDVLAPESDWKVAAQYSVGAGTNPQDIAAVSAERAYVARLGTADLMVVDPLYGHPLGSVDLSSYADSDGVPEVTGLYALNGRVYAVLALLEDFKPVNGGLLVVIDGETGEVEATVSLSHSNPSGKLRFNEVLNRFVLIETGGFTSLGGAVALDGIVETFDPETRSLSGAVITEEALGGDIVDAVIVSRAKGYAIIETGEDTSLVTSLVSFDPRGGEKLTTLSTAESWAYSAFELTPDHRALWLADRTRTRPGIRIFDVDSDQELTDRPLDVGLPPFMICFSEIAGSDLPASDDSDDADGGTTDPEDPEDLYMAPTAGDEPLVDETSCPVPVAPVLTIVPGGTTLEWRIPDRPDAGIQIGATRDLDADAPDGWEDRATYTFDEDTPPYAVKLFARAPDDGCEVHRVFSHVYNVRETFPPPPGEMGSTAMPLDGDRFSTWAAGWVDPVAYGEAVIAAWRTPERAVGPASGSSGDVVSLGRGGEIVMTFDIPVADDAGFDFAVFENGATDGFLDLAYVAASSDGETFATFDSLYLGEAPVAAFGTLDTRDVGGLAGKYPVGYGQPFDLHALANRPEVVSGDVDLRDIRYIKLLDVVGNGTALDSMDRPILDPYPTEESAGFDLDGIAVLCH